MPRGRPKGSKNKPKDPVVSPTEEDFLAPEPVFDNELNDMTERVGRKPKHNFDEDIELLPEVKTKDELSIEEELLEAERRINEPEVPLPPPQYAVKKKKIDISLHELSPSQEQREEEVMLVPERQQRAMTREQDYGDSLLETNLSQEVEAENNIKTVSKELFNEKSIELKTEVSHDEINHITKLQFLRDKFGISNVDVLTLSLLKLRVSKDRKSRNEFVQTVSAERQQNNGNFMSRMLGFGGNNNQGGN